MEYSYKATVAPDPDGGFLVTFEDVPEALTAGEDRAEALANAREALGLALRGILQEGRDLPPARAVNGVPVAVDAAVAAKLALVLAFRTADISKSELARRLGKTEGEARRILDPDHGTKIGQIEEALRALGKEIVLNIRDAA